MSGVQIMAEARRHTAGFLTERDIETIKRDPATRLAQVLVRCGGGRFQCAAQDVDHFIEIITRDGADYVRDVSLPAVRR